MAIPAHDASIHLWVICDLSILSPHYFSSRCDHSQLTNIHFDDRSFGKYTQRCIERGLRVLLYTNDGKLEGRFQLWMCYIRFLVA